MNNKNVDQSQAVAISRELSNQVEELIGGAHHEINNYNFLISTSIEIINLLPPGDPKKDEMMKQIENKMTEISSTLSKLRSVVKDASKEEAQSVSLKEMTNEVLLLCKRRFNNHHVILKNTIETDFVLHNRKTQIIQSLLSLLNNSHDAVANLNCDDGSKWIDMQVKENNNKLQIIVKDSAPLIKTSEAAQLFEPNSVVQGRKGLALLIVRDNIEQNGGTIEYAVVDKCNAIVITFNEYQKVNSASQTMMAPLQTKAISKASSFSRTKVG